MFQTFLECFQRCHTSQRIIGLCVLRWSGFIENCSSSTTTVLVEKGIEEVNAEYAFVSTKFTDDTHIIVGFSTKSLLQMVTCTVGATLNCTHVQTVQLDYGNGMYNSPSLAIDPNGLPIFVWQEALARKVMLLQCGNMYCDDIAQNSLTALVDVGGQGDQYDQYMMYSECVWIRTCQYLVDSLC